MRHSPSLVTSTPALRFIEEIERDLTSRTDWSTPSIRTLRRAHSRILANESAGTVMKVATRLAMVGTWTHRMLGYELLAAHPAAFAMLDDATVEHLGAGLSDWGAVDLFGVTIAGPAWREGLIRDKTVAAWAASDDRWRRRLALVATVPLNSRARGGTGDAKRTLAVCTVLKADRDPMVVKALSWALRELSKCEPGAVRSFVDAYDGELHSLVKREVRNKLLTGRKSPRR
jgi:3-methyladenine DNA glycosylase AlkD